MSYGNIRKVNWVMLRRKLKSFFIAIGCVGHEAHTNRKRGRLFVQALGRTRARVYRFFGYDVRMKMNGEYWFQLRDRRLEKKRTKRIIHALNRPL
jgi:hypothetical protein